MMYTELRALDSINGKGHGLKRIGDYGFSRQEGRVPLAMAELAEAVAIYPLAFAPRQGEGYQLLALLGLHHDENLFLDERNEWREGYVPSHIRGYPFGLRAVKLEGEMRAVLCFDHACGLYREDPDSSQGEVRFFDDQGKPQPWLQKGWEFLQKTAGSNLRTEGAVDALESAGLLIPWELPLKNPDPTRPMQPGLFRIDEAALSALDGKGLEPLHKVNALSVAYAQMFSTWRLKQLRQLYDLRHQQVAVAEEGFDTIITERQSDTLKFDWD